MDNNNLQTGLLTLEQSQDTRASTSILPEPVVSYLREGYWTEKTCNKKQIEIYSYVRVNDFNYLIDEPIMK